jgi:hypothetical protein
MPQSNENQIQSSSTPLVNKQSSYSKTTNAKMETTLTSTTTTSSSALTNSKTTTIASSSNNNANSINHNNNLNNSKPPQKHQPYSTSLVNSGFGFGFDLQGGESDNQLTFIVNVQPNGDAARKGLADGKLKFYFIV